MTEETLEHLPQASTYTHMDTYEEKMLFCNFEVKKNMLAMKSFVLSINTVCHKISSFLGGRLLLNISMYTSLNSTKAIFILSESSLSL